MSQGPYISKIQLPSGGTYTIKDKYARDAIAALEGGSYFLGVVEEDLSDGNTTNPVTVGDTTKTATNGNIVISGQKELI